MNEFDIYLESTGSMEVYPGNRMAVFRNLLPEPLQLDGDWRVALAEISLDFIKRHNVKTTIAAVDERTQHSRPELTEKT